MANEVLAAALAEKDDDALEDGGFGDEEWADEEDEDNEGWEDEDNEEWAADDGWDKNVDL